MRKLHVLFFLLAVVLALSACGPSREDREWMEQYQERQAQVEDVFPQLEAALYGAYDVDINVSNTSGTINAFVEVLVDDATRSDFGVIVSALATRFCELPEEYSDYAFGDIVLFYYYTTRNGRKLDDPSITYSLSIDEDTGRLFDSKSDLSMQFMTPEEVYYYLSGVSPDTKSIPNPTPKQEALVPDNSFSSAPPEIFSTTAEENGLADTAYYVDGEVVDRLIVGDYDTIQISTDSGDLYISSLLIDLPEISEGDSITVYFVYMGWSNNLDAACGSYVYSE